MDGMMPPQDFPLIRVFFGAVATVKKKMEVQVPEEPWRLCITQVTLGEKTPPNGTRITIKCGVGKEKPAVVGHIRVGSVETINFNSLEFPGGSVVVVQIAVQGKSAEGIEVQVLGEPRTCTSTLCAGPFLNSQKGRVPI